MLSSLILALAMQAEQTPPEPVQAVTIPETVIASDAAPVVIPRDTPVHLMVLNEVSTKDHDAGHIFKLRVNKPVMVDGKEVIPVGTAAWGELLEASSSGNVGKGGKLSAKLTYIEFNGQKIAIEGSTDAEGKSGKGENILGFIAMGPLALFAKGNNAKIKAGEKMTAFIAEDVTLIDVE